VLDAGEVDLCLKDPGYEVDIHVLGDVRTLTHVWQGYMSVEQAIKSGKLAMEGARHLITPFRKSLKLSMLVNA
jgi:hypothetical protein